MTVHDFTYVLKHPQRLDKSQISDIRSIINEFPYFQSARALYLKGLKNEESFKYNQELKTTAAYTTDRSVLFDFITSEVFSQNEISEHIKQNIEHLKDIDVNDVEDISVNKKVIIDQGLEQHIENTKPVLDPNLFEAKESESNAIETGNALTPEEALDIGKPLDFKKDEAHSFSEWLKITSFKPIQRKKEVQEEHDKDSSREDKFKMIDEFIKTNPKIQPVDQEDYSHQNIAKAQMLNPKSLMTETLAKIYLEQKNYEKAIKSYKILSLKYPEKSGFFADQIKAIKELQKNKI